PVWFRWWAIVIEIILFATGLFLIIRYREKELKQRAILLKKEINDKTREVLEQRKEVDELKSRFYVNISHEFRTPLTLMIGPLEDSVKRAGDPVSLDKKILEIMLRNAQRLLRLINQLLDISKLELGNMQLNLVRADLSDFIRTVSSSFLSFAESHHIEYHIRVDVSPGSTCFDADKVEKVITNLLSNAFKFTSEGDSVGINLEYIESRDIPGTLTARLKIVDTGRGIEEEKLQHIFERFYQASDSDTREAEGTGIGLALTREMVELMQGEIEVESTLGSGTTFTVLFPVSEEYFPGSQFSELTTEGPIQHEIDSEKESTEVIISNVSDHDSRRLILVVEDNADLRKYIRMQLEPEYRVVEAMHGKKGQEIAIKRQPVLVITDLMMPVMGGTELCRNLKMHQATDHIPVIMLTAKGDMESKLDGLETGADEYMIKPFDTRELRVRVKNLIAQREKLREGFQEIFLNDEETSGSHAQTHMLRGIIEVTKRHLDDPEFDVIRLAGEMAFSRSQLYRKVYGVAGTTPNELIRMIRMKEAARLLRTGELNVTQVMYQVGMKNTSHFARTFKKFYGTNPGGYVKKVLP
ncbi:MAG: ATP-binding response regulator, partial [Bacteroidales bacterium]